MTAFIKALEKIKNVYTLKYDTAKSNYSHLEKECADAQKQLDDIMVYYDEYCRILNLQSSNGLNIHQLKNQHGFIGQFLPVISHQKNIIENIKNKIIIEKENLIKCYKDLKSIEHILEEKHKLMSEDLIKKEIISQEEVFVNMHKNNKSL